MSCTEPLPDTRKAPFAMRGYHPVLNTAILTTEEDFLALRAEWSELQASTKEKFFLTWEWLHTWWQHLADDRVLHIITARHDGRLIAIAPLAWRPRRMLRLLPFPVLEFLGSGSVGSDYLGMLVRNGFEEEAMRSIAHCVTSCGLVLELSHVDRLARRMIAMALQLRQLGWYSHKTTVNHCPFVNLSGHSWNSYLASLGATHRTNFRRRLKKLSARFAMRIDHVSSEPEREAALRILVALHLKRWSQRGGSDALHRPELIAFHEEMTKTALRNKWLRLSVLWLDDKPAAAVYSFVYNKVYYFYQAGFDVDFSDYSVGLVMTGLMIKSAIEEGASEFDFLHGEELYKYLWTRDERELVRYDLFPPDQHGARSKRFMEVRRNIKQLLGKLLPSRHTHSSVDRRDKPYWIVARARDKAGKEHEAAESQSTDKPSTDQSTITGEL